MVVASLLIYYAEHDAQPQQFQNAFSGLWRAVATLTTVGYGDIYPITPLGRFMGAIIAVLGIGMSPFLPVSSAPVLLNFWKRKIPIRQPRKNQPRTRKKNIVLTAGKNWTDLSVVCRLQNIIKFLHLLP